ncbi:hypothetical protein GGR56DRAFT_647023 [Xylariaceae sp. FL0804]|nr:hypothetical protein GGR56DRAFT_647023 [Xylariaceae sp. FL0804]
MHSSTIFLAFSALLPLAASERQWSGGLTSRARTIASSSMQSRQIDLSGLAGLSSLGELILGGDNTNNAAATAGQATASATLGASPTGASALALQSSATVAVAGSDVVAVDEADQFDGELGITVDGAGNVANLGGDLGITQGSDGSTSVGGEAGINIAA